MARIYIADENPLLSFGTKIKHLAQHWGWVLAFGCVYLALGLLALGMPVESSIALAKTLGTLLFISGLIQLVHAIQLRHESGSGSRYFQTFLSLIGGGLMLRFPDAGLFAITIILSFYFLLGAFVKWALALAVRPNKGWGWVLTSAITSIILGAYVVASLPWAALWVPGTVLGIDFIFAGLSMIRLSTELRHLRSDVRAL